MNATISGHFGIVFEETWSGKSNSYCNTAFFESFVFKIFSVYTLKRKHDVFKCLQL